MGLRFAYNTNGAANHRLTDALALIADTGYEGVALTIDHHHLDPFAPELQKRSEDLAKTLRSHGLGLVLETGARYLLNPRKKHEPTLVAPDRQGRALRIDFLARVMRIARICDAETVSFWAGVPQSGVSRDDAWGFLREGIAELLTCAEKEQVEIALEPEPGMLVETLADFQRLQAEFPKLRLALDTGHCLVSGDSEPEDAVTSFHANIGTVSLEDMRRGVHEHLPFGEGDMNVPAVLRALHGIEFRRLVCVELSRESHRAHQMIPQALSFLKRAEAELR